MNTPLITEEVLSKWVGYQRKGDLERFLDENQIPYFRGKGDRVITTLGLIESAKLSQIGSQEVDF